MMWTLILSNLFGLLIIYQVGSATLKKRIRKDNLNVIILLVIFLSQCLINYNGPTKYSAITTFIIFFITLFIFFKASLISTLITTFFLECSMVISEFIAMLLMNVFLGLNSVTSQTSTTYILSLLLSNILFCIFAYGYVKIKKTFLIISYPKYSWILILVPLSTLIVLLLIPEYFSLIENNKEFIVSLLLLLLSNIITIILYFRFVYNLKYKDYLKEEKQQREALEHEMKLYSQYYQENFNLLHDLLHSYSRMKYDLDSGNLISLKEELETLSNKTFVEFNSIYSESYTLNVLINNQLENLRKFNISIRTNLKTLDFSFFSRADEIMFLKSILNISIQSCKNQLNGKIFIISEKNYNQIVIRITFSANKDLANNLNANEEFNSLVCKYNILTLYDYNSDDQIMTLSFIYNNINQLCKEDVL